MKQLAGCLLFVFFLLPCCIFAQDADPSAPDSGVLVSSPTHVQVSGQDSPDNNGSKDRSDRGSNLDDSGQQKHQNKDTDSKDASSVSTDEIVIKATDAVMFQMIANLKLTPDQINAARPIVMDNIIKVRDLQQQLEKGDMDSKAMYNQRKKLNEDEDQALSHIFNSDQLKEWVNIQSE